MHTTVPHLYKPWKIKVNNNCNMQFQSRHAISFWRFFFFLSAMSRARASRDVNQLFCFVELCSLFVGVRDLVYKVIFQDPDCRNAVCWAEKYPKTKEPDTLTTSGSTSQEAGPQGLDLGRSTASNQAIANLRPRPRCRSSELQFYLLPKSW